MKQYRARAIFKQYFTAVIEAESLEDAREQVADMTDMDEWDDERFDSFDIDDELEEIS